METDCGVGAGFRLCRGSVGAMGGLVVGRGRQSGGVALLTTGYKPAPLAGCDFFWCGYRWCRSWTRSTTG